MTESITALPIEDLIETCHGAAKAGGWWHDIKTGKPLDRDYLELKMLMLSEVAEAMEGLRKNLKDDKLPHRPMEEVELADTVIRICDFIGGTGYLYRDSDYRGMLGVGLHENRAANLFEICQDIVTDHLESALAGISSYGASQGYKLLDAIHEKIAFNANRADHKPENRKKAGGKKF